MSIRPLDVAQNIGTQSQLAADKASERHAERSERSHQAQRTLEQAQAELHRVQKQGETVGKIIRDRDPADHPAEHEIAHHADIPGTDDHHPHHPIHADESPEGKGLAVDIDA